MLQLNEVKKKLVSRERLSRQVVISNQAFGVGHTKAVLKPCSFYKHTKRIIMETSF